jgi:hypothetical protein
MSTTPEHQSPTNDPAICWVLDVREYGLAAANRLHEDDESSVCGFCLAGGAYSCQCSDAPRPDGDQSEWAPCPAFVLNENGERVPCTAVVGESGICLLAADHADRAVSDDFDAHIVAREAEPIMLTAPLPESEWRQTERPDISLPAEHRTCAHPDCEITYPWYPRLGEDEPHSRFCMNHCPACNGDAAICEALTPVFDGSRTTLTHCGMVLCADGTCAYASDHTASIACPYHHDDCAHDGHPCEHALPVDECPDCTPGNAGTAVMGGSDPYIHDLAAGAAFFSSRLVVI